MAEQSRRHSAADLMVANTLDGAKHWAFLGPVGGRYERVPRRELPDRLVRGGRTTATRSGRHMANVLLGATGSVAAVRMPALFDALTADGHAVKVVATDAATVLLRPGRPLDRTATRPQPGVLVILDADEWPGRRPGERTSATTRCCTSSCDVGRPAS